MITIKSTAFHLMPVNVIWFANKPKKWNFLLSYYKQSAFSGIVPGYYREPFFTKIINIADPKETFEQGFDQNTTYEIRRAIKDGVITETETDIQHFIDFYNAFAITKHLPKLNKDFYRYQDRIIITKAIYNNQDIVMHSYLKDDSLKRIRLLQSASLFRNETDTQLRAIIGRANRLLHFKDMCFFKEQGFEIYDLGGYAQGTSDKALARINQFKDSFGGELIKESDYLPISALGLRFFTKLLKV
jgi:hypothetical protein